MEPVNKSQLRSYYRGVRGGLICAGKEKRVLLANLRENVSGYLAENPRAGIEEIQARFGSPEYIAAYSLRDLPDRQLVKKVHIRRRIAALFAAAVLAALLILGTGMGTVVSNDYANKGGYLQVISDESN